MGEAGSLREWKERKASAEAKAKSRFLRFAAE
jgi:hypothetical protein